MRSLFLLLFPLLSLSQSKPFVLGSIEIIKSIQLGEERTLNIYLPEGYKQDDTTKYPVIYLLDGSADEDFIHIVGAVQYNSFEWINRLPKSIVVGIANVDRKRDFTYPTSLPEDKKTWPTTGGSEKFIAFIEKELQPFIEKKYKTNNSKMLIGQSLGGLLATEILFKKSSLFNKYIIVSPSLWWDDGSLLKKELPGLKRTTLVYVGVGKEGLSPTAKPHIMTEDVKQLVEKLTSSKDKNLKLFHEYLPEEDHATIMHQAVMNAFKLMATKGK